MAKRKTIPKPVPPPEQADAAVVAACVAYGSAIGAYHGGFKCDPEGCMETAAKVGGQAVT
jgi:hypothetical protein